MKRFFLIAAILSLAAAVEPGRAAAQATSPRPTSAVPAAPDIVESATFDYPPTALAAGIEGPLTLRLQLAPTGLPDSFRYVAGPTELMYAAINGARKMRFTPTLANGSGAPVDIHLTVWFTRELADGRRRGVVSVSAPFTIKPGNTGGSRRTVSSKAAVYPVSATSIRMSGAAAVFELLVGPDGAVLSANLVATVRSLPARNDNRIELPDNMRQAMTAAMMARRYEPLRAGEPRYAEYVTAEENATLPLDAAFENLLRLADSYDAEMATLEQLDAAAGGPAAIPRIFEGGPVPKLRQVRDAVPVYPPIAASA
jgi:TonB-like protein